MPSTMPSTLSPTRRWVALLLLTTALLPTAAAEEEAGSAPEARFLAAAREIGDDLVGTARPPGDEGIWAQYEGDGPAAAGEALSFPVSLYAGSAGAGLYLLDLWRVTGDERYLETAVAAGRRLLAAARPAGVGALAWKGAVERRGRVLPDGDGLGLYVGNAGIGCFLTAVHDATGDPAFLEGAKGAFARVLLEAKADDRGVHWERGARDVIAGEAGIGLALLSFSRATGDARYRVLAEKAAAWLVAEATRDEHGARWERGGRADPAFSHGAAGIAFFLASVGGRESTAVARAAAAWIRSRARDVGAGALLWDYYGGSPPAGRRDWVMNSWCHGAAGTIRLFLRLHRVTGEGEWLDVAARGGGGVLHAAGMDAGACRYANTTRCCGAAGLIDALLDLHRATGDERWLVEARRLGDDVLTTLVPVGGKHVLALYDEADEKTRAHPYVPTGWMQGNAGLGHALLRLAVEKTALRDHLPCLPDDPFAPLWTGRAER